MNTSTLREIVNDTLFKMKYPEDFINKVICGDCLSIMPQIPDKSIDMILCDLPYGTTACKWDTIIPFEPLWKQYKRIIKDNGAIVLTASQPFTSALVMSNIKMFKYELLWLKEQGNQPQLCNIQPMKAHENILIFGNGKLTYNPQFTEGKPYSDNRKSKKGLVVNNIKHLGKTKFSGTVKNNVIKRFPLSFRQINCERTGLHPTQKPVVLFEYLIKTYTNEGDLVLDNCAGSGTTGVACKNLNRKYILIEKEPKYIEIINKRLNP